jgi:methylenetetrahydrofolate dehydrogenase (NADP+)/methenyltetrahydrofolate cyclohydrolase
LASLGSVEQNIFTPQLYNDPSLNVTAVSSMFRRSPLCIASLGPLKDGDVIGAHEDTVELLQRIFPKQKVVASPRGTKNTDLFDGTYQGIQAYTTTEVPALHHLMESRGMDPNAVTFQVLEDVIDGSSGGPPQLGYSQMLFVANEALENQDRREAAKAFLSATFDGWQQAIRNPDEAIEAVSEAQKMLKLDDESNDHWYESLSFKKEMLELTNNHVKETFVGDLLGVLSSHRWSKATEWLLHDKKDVDPLLGFDQTNLWSPPANLLHGNELAREALEEAEFSAMKFEKAHGRKPSLAVITVGELARYEHSERRVQLYSNPSNSWFTKTDVGKANGFDVTEINLDKTTTTTDDVLSEIYKIRDSVDGIQVMWPLPESIDSAKVYNAVPLAKDVDGIHYTSWGAKYPPVTPAGAWELMKSYNVDVRGKHVVVVGRSPIVGLPMAHMLREAGAMVSVAHTGVDKTTFQGLVGQADVVVTCAGSPGCVQAEWLKDGAEVVNIGTTFCEKEDALLSDIEGDIGAKAARYSPTPAS